MYACSVYCWTIIWGVMLQSVAWIIPQFCIHFNMHFNEVYYLLILTMITIGMILWISTILTEWVRERDFSLTIIHFTTHYTVRTYTNIKAYKSKVSIATAKESHRHSEPMGCLGTTWMLRARAGKSTWGRASNSQAGLYHAPWWCCGRCQIFQWHTCTHMHTCTYTHTHLVSRPQNWFCDKWSPRTNPGLVKSCTHHKNDDVWLNFPVFKNVTRSDKKGLIAFPLFWLWELITFFLDDLCQ